MTDLPGLKDFDHDYFVDPEALSPYDAIIMMETTEGDDPKRFAVPIGFQIVALLIERDDLIEQ